jgi:hypothetical protein
MAAVITDEEFGELFHRAHRSARRLETRDRYDVVSEHERERLFQAGRLTDTRTRADRIEWEQTVREGVSRGVRFERVRVVPDSVTDYHRFLLHQARFNVEYGEDVRYLRRARADALDLPDRDFWVRLHHPAVDAFHRGRPAARLRDRDRS